VSEKYFGILMFGVGIFILALQYNKKLLEWLKYESLGTRDYIVETLSYMFIEVEPQKILMGMFLFSFGLASLVFLICIPFLLLGFILGVLAGLVGWFLPKPLVRFLFQRRIDKFVWQMVDGLSLMSNGLKSGLSVIQSIGLITQEMSDPMRQEFSLVLNQNKLGVSVEEAFINLSKRVPADDVEMFVTSINILKETGGNLSETLDTIVSTIRERVKIQKKISAMTAQGFYQGMLVMSIPPLLGFTFYQTDPAFMRPLFTTIEGMLVVVTIILLEVIAFFAIIKIIKIDV
jgi:tight adherence protein B